VIGSSGSATQAPIRDQKTKDELTASNKTVSAATRSSKSSRRKPQTSKREIRASRTAVPRKVVTLIPSQAKTGINGYVEVTPTKDTVINGHCWPAVSRTEKLSTRWPWTFCIAGTASTASS
jgi:hypothetical protein